MSTIDLDSALRTVVARELDVAPDRLTTEMELVELGLDDDEKALGVIVAVEDVLDVRFPDDFLDGVRTYGDLASAVRIAIGR